MPAPLRNVQLQGCCLAAWRHGLFFAASIAMAVRVKISRLMTIMRMMHSWLLNQWRRTLVPVTVLIEVAGHMALVRVMGAGLGGGLGGHTDLHLVENLRLLRTVSHAVGATANTW